MYTVKLEPTNHITHSKTVCLPENDYHTWTQRCGLVFPTPPQPTARTAAIADSMPLHNFVALLMPASFVVPDGALDHAAVGMERERRAPVMRSNLAIPLAEQHAVFKEEADIFEAELLALNKLSESWPCLAASFSAGLFSKQSYIHRADEHPANTMALEAASKLLLNEHGVLMAEVATAFLKTKQRVLHTLFERFGPDAVYVPSFLACNLADPEVLATVREGRGFLEAYDFICDRLNVIRLPTKTEGGRWALTLLPNIVGASDADLMHQVGVYYQLHTMRQRLGTSLTRTDVCNLKAILPSGSGTRTLLDFLIIKFSDRATRDNLGYTPGRAKSLVNRYDRFCRRLQRDRAQAELKVAGKVIKTTGEGVKDARAAAEHEMRRAVRKEKVRTLSQTLSPSPRFSPPLIALMSRNLPICRSC